MLQVNNVTKIAEIAHRYGAISIVDNIFVTPYLQQSLDQGADIVIHSATKYLAGHSEVNVGLVVVKDDELGKRVYFAQNRLGGVLAPNVTSNAFWIPRTCSLTCRISAIHAR